MRGGKRRRNQKGAKEAEICLHHVKMQHVLRSKHCWRYKSTQLMLYREIITVCSATHTKRALYGQNVEFVNVNPGGAYSNHWASSGLTL
jgi:hypothetical protein